MTKKETQAEIIAWIQRIYSENGSSIEDDITVRDDLKNGVLLEYISDGNPFSDSKQEYTYLKHENDKFRRLVYLVTEYEGKSIVIFDYVKYYDRYVDAPDENETIIWIGNKAHIKEAENLLRKEYEEFIANEISEDLISVNNKIGKINSENINEIAGRRIRQNIREIMRKML